MMAREVVVYAYTINEIKDKTAPIANAYGIGGMSLFGSYARGEVKDDSDVDLYIERGRLKSLLQNFSFIDELENVLDCHVDVVTTGIGDKQFLSTIMKEGYFYMRNEDIPVPKKFERIESLNKNNL